MIVAVPRPFIFDLAPGSSKGPGRLAQRRLAPAWTVLRVLVLSAAALGLWAAPEPAAPAVAARQELAPAIALSHRAERLKAAFKSGDADQLQVAVQDVELLRRSYGTLDVLPLVEAMAIFARDQGNAGHPDLGLQVVRTVEPWAPKYPTLLGTRVILMRQKGIVSSMLSMADVFELTRLRLTHPIHRWLWVVQHIAWLRLMATLLLWGWAITMGLRYRRVFRYLWEEPLARRGLNPHVVALLGAFLITLPVIVGLDPSLAAMVWLILLAPFLLPHEIRATLLVMGLYLVHPALALLEPMAARHPEPSLVTLQLRPQTFAEDDRVFAKLPAGDRAFLAGWRHLQFQEWAPAEATFAALARTHPDRAAVLNNLGVARFQQGNLAGAQLCFDDAARTGPVGAEILQNQSVVAFKQMDSQLGANKQDEARRINPEVFAQLLAANQARNDQRTFAVPLADTPDRIRALQVAPAASSESSSGPIKDNAVLFNLMLPFLAIGLFYLRLRKSISESHPSQCTRCGDPFHTTDSPDVFVCSKCHHLFVLKDGLHGESRKKKVDGVATYQTSQRWIHRMFILLLPGADRCFIGDTRRGFVEYVSLTFAIGVVLATGRSVRYPGEVLADPASAWLPLGLGLLTVLFVRSWFKLLPRRF